jgi:large subunit ribosomal protein L6
MSRIGKLPIRIPQGVSVDFSDRILKVKGSKGELSMEVSYEVELEISEEEIGVRKTGKTRLAPAMWGTTRALIANMIQGVTEGFKKQLELNGVGYKMSLSGKKLVFNLGFSHPIEKELPEGLSANIEKNVLTIEGIDKQQVGHLASVIRSFKPVEPYKGKGLMYVGEQVTRKEGKKSGSE